MRLIVRAALASVTLIGATPVTARPAAGFTFQSLSVCVPDLGKSARFLGDVFGWRAASPNGTPPVDGRDRKGVHEVQWIDAGDLRLQLRQLGNDRADRHCSNGVYSGIEFTTADLPKARNGLPKLPWPVHLTRGTSVSVRARAEGDHSRQTNVGRVTAPKVDRIALIVRDAEKTASFYTQVLGFRRNPATVTLDGKDNKQSGGIRAVFIDANGIWLALVQPVGPGPLNAYLDRYGDGTIAELIVEVPRISDFYDLMVSKGMTLVDTRGDPVDPRIKAHVLQPYGDKIAYFPPAATGGLTIEIVERGPAATSLLERRDRGWRRSNDAAPR